MIYGITCNLSMHYHYKFEIGNTILQVTKMGVTSILVGNGVNLGALREGLTKFSKNLESIEKNKQKWLKKYTQNSDSSEKNKPK